MKHQQNLHTNHKPYQIFYTILGLVLVFQVFYTVFQSSLVVSHGLKQNQLQDQYQQLSQERAQLEAELIAKKSLLNHQSEEKLAQYQPIANPIVINISSSLAVAE